MMKQLDAVDKIFLKSSMNFRNQNLTSRLDPADDDVVDFIVSDLLVATSKKYINQ
jgi:hypothetical protein